MFLWFKKIINDSDENEVNAIKTKVKKHWNKLSIQKQNKNTSSFISVTDNDTNNDNNNGQNNDKIKK